MVPNIGEASPRVIARLQPIGTSIFNVTSDPTSTGRKSRFRSAPKLGHERQQHAIDDTATLVIFLGVPEGILSRAVEARR